ncbi:MAG: radical SAM protein [Acidobacteriaceae bacterium]|nr:radical SAM protein [Acidobacteriaceae bacterium]
MNTCETISYSPLSTLGNIAWKATSLVANLLQTERPHPSWAPGPLPKASERSRPDFGFPRSTQSLCPGCNKEAVEAVLNGSEPLSSFRDRPGVIEAQLVEEAGRILMRKACPIHGPYEDVISNDPAFTERMESLYFGNDFDRSAGLARTHEGPLSVTKGRASFLIVDLTNRCNMKCTPCFMDANQQHYVHEMTIADVKQVFDRAQAIKPRREISILFSGGEPTIAPVFLDAVRYARKAGFTRLHVATNGIRFAEDLEFVKQSKEAGLHGVYLQIDGTTNAANAHRGVANLFDVKVRALDNIKRAGMRATLQVTVVNGLNNTGLGNLVQFAVENIDRVQGVVFQPIMFAGRDANTSDEARYERRYTLSDLAHDLSQQSPGEIEVMRDWFPMSVYSAFSHVLDQANPFAEQGSVYPDIHPNHGQFCPLIVNSKSGVCVPLARFFNVDGFVKDLRVIGDRFNGRILTRLQVTASIIRNFKADAAPPDLRPGDLLNLFRQMQVRFKYDGSELRECNWRLFIVAGMWFQDLFNFDLSSIQMSSTVVAANSQDGEISFCAYNAAGWRAMNEDLNKTAQLSEWHKLHGRHTIYANGKLVDIEVVPSYQLQTQTGNQTPTPTYSEREMVL